MQIYCSRREPPLIATVRQNYLRAYTVGCKKKERKKKGKRKGNEQKAKDLSRTPADTATKSTLRG